MRINNALAACLATWFFIYILRQRTTCVTGIQHDVQRENATLLMLVRNKELIDALISIRQIEDRFNRNFHYPWVFLNDQHFSEEFKAYVKGMASGEVEFGVIPSSQWSMPGDIDVDRATQSRKKMEMQGIIYGGSLSYRHMCRFNSGFFAHQDLLQNYKYYWRVEPNIQFSCTIPDDPFAFMRMHSKAYGFVIALPEYEATIPTLWKTVQQFARWYPQYINPNNAAGFVLEPPDSDIQHAKFNLCHFWSNFEIADLDFWRSEAYTAFFDHLDRSGGFYYERWGDAPVHSIAAALLLPRDAIHFFDEIGYGHVPWTRCPSDDASHVSGRCLCSREDSFDYSAFSCLPRWQQLIS